jgi:dTDP-4-amino-4,6-dideoxygalactose transaminase
MTPETLLECIKKNKLKKIKVIVTMYLAGHPENIIEFYSIKKKYKCFLIEDACHAFGARYQFKSKKTNEIPG